MRLWEHQKETLKKLEWMEKNRGNFSTVVNLPTGSGKTGIAVEFCNRILKDENKNGKILWLADRNQLLSMAEDKFSNDILCQEIFDKKEETPDKSNLSTNDKKKNIVKPKTGELFAEKANIVFSTIRRMAKIYKEKEDSFETWLGDSKLYVIYDEAHHIGAGQAFNLFTALFGSNSYDNSVKVFYNVETFAIIGLTATVYRGDKFLDSFKAFFKDGYSKKEKKFYHSDSPYGQYDDVDIQSVDEVRIAIADIDELIEGYEGDAPVLAEPQIIKVDEFMNGMPPRKEKPKDASDQKSREEYLKNEFAMEYLAERIKKNKSAWGKMAVVVNNIAEAETLKGFLKEKAILWVSKTEVSYKNSSESIRTKEEVETFFEEGKCEDKILICVHKFDEGIDVPDLETLYLFAKTNSQIVLRQRIGRVVRKSADKDKVARVIWQQYPEKEVYLSENDFKELCKKIYDYKVQTPKDLEADYEEWMQNNKLQLPAIMYRKPLLVDFTENYSTWMLFKAEEIFGTDIINQAKGVGFFYNADEYEFTDDVIFVRNVEYEGYLQFQRLLKNDWISMLRYEENKNITFEDYAKILKVSSATALEDIKEVCFYQRDARNKDSLGEKVSQRIFVRDGDIKTFFRWFISGTIEYKNLRVGKAQKDDVHGDKELFKKVWDSDYEEKKFDCEATPDCLEKLKEKLEKPVKPDKDDYEKKEYTKLLTYGGENCYRDNYQEMLSKKFMMRAGITDVLPRVVIEKNNDNIEIDAFCGEKYIKRKSNTTISREDWILYASALVEIPNHIYITQDDVNEYEEAIKEKVLSNVTQNEKEQAVKECLLVLGYAKNDKIIKYQCERMQGKLPKLLQYVIYQKCYYELIDKIQFVKDDVLHPCCVNRELLESRYNELLGDFGINSSQMLVDPVEDVIYDYRPYLKAVYYYQGIKPEFLCRMANDLIQCSKTHTDRVVDGFGGSGAYTMNVFFAGKNPNPKQVYNDLGIMNTAFYECLKDSELKKELIKQIQEIINEAFSNYNENEPIEYINSKYGRFMDDLAGKKLFQMSYWGKDIKRCEKDYSSAYNKKVDQYRKDMSKNEKNEKDMSKNEKNEKDMSKDEKNEKDTSEDKNYSYRSVKIEDRLHYMNEKFSDDDKNKDDKNKDDKNKDDKNKDDKKNETAIKTIRNVERYFHVFMLQLNAVYLAMTETEIKEYDFKEYGISDVDLAVLFFFYNTLSHRHFYNDCTIKQIGKMMRNYEKWLGYGAECFKGVRVLKEDAMKLLASEKYNKEGTTWYLDIPYAETDSSDYVAQGFDMKEFVDKLSKLKGNYIVSSRCNICLPNEDKRDLSSIPKYNLKDLSEDEITKLPESVTVSNKYVKELNVFSFFSSFIAKTDELMDFIESLKIEKTIEEDKKEENEEKTPIETPIDTVHISEGKAAKYILIPYTKMSEKYYDKDGKVKRRLVDNSSVISEDYVRRMLTATHYSNVPVDIMVTDIDIDLNKMPIQPTFNKEGQRSESVYVFPTFKTGVDSSQYMTEPAVIIMKYDKFMKILCSLLYREEWRCYCADKEVKDTTELFRNMFKKHII